MIAGVGSGSDAELTPDAPVREKACRAAEPPGRLRISKDSEQKHHASIAIRFGSKYIGKRSSWIWPLTKPVSDRLRDSTTFPRVAKRGIPVHTAGYVYVPGGRSFFNIAKSQLQVRKHNDQLTNRETADISDAQPAVRSGHRPRRWGRIGDRRLVNVATDGYGQRHNEDVTRAS